MLHRTTHYWGWLVCPLADRNRENPDLQRTSAAAPGVGPVSNSVTRIPTHAACLSSYLADRNSGCFRCEAFFDLQWPFASEQATALRFYQLASSHPVRGFCR
jgi:hypothetical protein